MTTPRSTPGFGNDEEERADGDPLDPYAPVRLGLFTPARNEVEAVFAALDALDFECAERLSRGCTKCSRSEARPMSEGSS